MLHKTREFNGINRPFLPLLAVSITLLVSCAGSPARSVCTPGHDVLFPAHPPMRFVLAVNTGADTRVCDAPRLEVALRGSAGEANRYVIRLQKAESQIPGLGLPAPKPGRRWIAFAALQEDLEIHRALMDDWSRPSDEAREFTMLLDYATAPQEVPTEMRLRLNNRDGITAICRPAL